MSFLDPIALTILHHPCPEWRASVQNYTRKDVFETRNKEKSRVFRVFDIGLFVLHNGGYEPFAELD